MSSKYADKHQSTADCTYPHCDDPGTRLALLKGVPHWFCESHFDQLEEDL